MKSIVTWLATHLEELLGACLLGAMAVLAMANVLTRYLIDLPIAFTEELEVNAMVWMTLFGAAAAFRKKRHLRLTFFLQNLPARGRWFIERFTSLCAVILFACLGYLGWLQLLDERLLGITSESLGYPQWIYTVAIPAGAVLVIIRIIIVEITAWQSERPWA
ncbi:MAG TPA: C4-dicarboxylate ABC transporter permease [Desulfofustis sp.]|jgi:TRAP-type C4-dicarboxylate transport system permease small subunit|nr:TRAP transporter small permease [Desulfofustis sp. PB-SRB1]HBH27612.1 C4-dicarboxylate ABC transporter permease [Desulfofustis sp.]HBH32845.1 C4-dicarboxylate ABC transporter permease [Desulfofustis sp.]